LERLVETGSGQAPGATERARQDARNIEKIKALGRDATRLPKLKRRQEAALLTEIRGQLAGGFLFVEHVGVLVTLLAAFSSSETVAPNQTFEGAGLDLVLTIDRRWGVFAGNLTGGEMPDPLPLLRHLGKNSWFVITEHGPTIRVGLGVRAKKVWRAA
jgi:hypothetical protein